MMMERSAIGDQAKYNIMSNELRRRLEVLSEGLTEAEVNGVINRYIQQLTNSGYSWKQQREIIVSALKGHVRRESAQIKNGEKTRYRSGQSSLRSRVEKKLTEKYNWFRRRKKIGENREGREAKSDDKEKGKERKVTLKIPKIVNSRKRQMMNY